MVIIFSGFYLFGLMAKINLVPKGEFINSIQNSKYLDNVQLLPKEQTLILRTERAMVSSANWKK